MIQVFRRSAVLIRIRETGYLDELILTYFGAWEEETVGSTLGCYSVAYTCESCTLSSRSSPSRTIEESGEILASRVRSEGLRYDQFQS